MKPYASYKPSGVPWLGDVPGHWAGKRLRDCVYGCSNGVWGDDPDGGDNDIPVIRVADFDRERRRVVEYETVRKVEGSQRRGRALVSGDMLIEKSGGGEQQPVGMVVSYLGPQGAVCSNFVARMAAREGVVSRFMVYLHAYLYASRVTNLSIKQTTGIQNLDSTAYLSEACFVPPACEQQAIADYLDVETARIDTLMHEKTELIGLLREWRQSVIAETVTKGLDKSVTTKPSGVQWLGEVPSHWEVVPLRYLSRGVKTGGTPAQEAFVDEQSEGVIPWYAPADLKDLFLTGCSRMVAAEYRSEVDVFAPGTIALVGIGDVGRVAMLTEEGTGNQQLNFIRPVAGIASTFLTYALMAAQEFVRSRANVTLIPILNQENTKRLRFAVPTPEEQRAIAAYLDAETAKIDGLIAHTNDEITLLQELRAATIADAVLGRVDVRTAPKQ